MQQSSIERQTDHQQQQLIEDQAVLQTHIMNTELENWDELSAEESDDNTDNDLYKIKNFLVEKVHWVQDH